MAPPVRFPIDPLFLETLSKHLFRGLRYKNVAAKYVSHSGMGAALSGQRPLSSPDPINRVYLGQFYD